MTYPWPTLMPMGIVVISCIRPSVQPSMGLGLCIAYKALGRNGLQFGMLMYPDGLHSAFMDAYGYCCWSVCPSICPLIRVGAKEGGSHYWEMAVAITCGYGGYLLPLLAAHSNLSLFSCKQFMRVSWPTKHNPEKQLQFLYIGFTSVFHQPIKVYCMFILNLLVWL